jgi:hypothetical protein
MPAPTALLRKADEFAEAAVVPLPQEGETFPPHHRFEIF